MGVGPPRVGLVPGFGRRPGVSSGEESPPVLPPAEYRTIRYPGLDVYPGRGVFTFRNLINVPSTTVFPSTSLFIRGAVRDYLVDVLVRSFGRVFASCNLTQTRKATVAGTGRVSATVFASSSDLDRTLAVRVDLSSPRHSVKLRKPHARATLVSVRKKVTL